MAKKQQTPKPPVPPMQKPGAGKMPKMPPTTEDHNAMLERMRRGKKK